MEKTFKILFMLILIGNIGFGQGLKITFNYAQLQEVATQLGTNNALALYAVKETGITTLKYAIYNLSTKEVSYFDGHTISNSEFLSIANSQILDETIKFRGKNKSKFVYRYGATGIARDKDGGTFIINGLKVLNKQPESIKNKAIYELFVSKNIPGKIIARFTDDNGQPLKNQNGTPVGGGGGTGPGGDGTITPAPPKSN